MLRWGCFLFFHKEIFSFSSDPLLQIILAAGNAKFLNFGSNIAGLMMFMFLGQVNYTYGIIMGIAQLAGAVCGSKFAIKRGSGYVRALFIAVTCLLLAKNVYDYIH